MTVYFISGLGADKRAFKRLMLPLHWTVRYIDWIDNTADESLLHYCQRLSSQVDTSQSYALVGLSFGGVVAVEMSKFLQPQKTVIISSIATKDGLPKGFLGELLIKKLKLHRRIPSSFYKKVSPLTYWLFGVKNKDEKGLLKEIIHDTQPEFAKWAMGKIMEWDNTVKPANLVHIHGTSDRIFPVKYANPDIKIKEGGHFMIYNKATEISGILRTEI